MSAILYTDAVPSADALIRPTPAPAETPLSDAELHAGFRSLVEEHYGLRLAEHQTRWLDEEVQRLATRSGAGTPAALYDQMTRGGRGDLLAALAAAVTVGETHFFRVAPQIQALRQVILPELLARRAAERRLRVWSAGCSTGEEPYTLAILLREQLPALDTWDISILATDISPAALNVAREGLYGEWSFRDTPLDVRQRYFAPETKRWRLAESLRRMVRFRPLNLIADAFPTFPDGGAFDLILCRNVTIYFGPETTQRLYRRFTGALAPDGWLVLGPSDPPPDPGGPLHPAYLPGAVLWRPAVPAGSARPETQKAPPDVRPVAGNKPLPDAVSGLTTSRRIRAAHPPVARPVRPSRLVTPASRPPAVPPVAVGGAEQVWALVQGGDRQAARSQAETMVRRRPLDAEPHLVLGMLYLDEGASEPALAALRRATYLDPGNALAHFSLGRVYRQRGEAERARAALGHARRLIATLADGAPVHGGGGLAAGDLRLAVDAAIKGSA